MDIDFHYLYFSPFPDGIAIIFCFLAMFLFLIFVILTSCRIGCEDYLSQKCCEPPCLKLWLIIPYLGFTLGYFIYIIYCYYNLYVINELDTIKEIEAETIIKELIKEVDARHQTKVFHIMDIKLVVIQLK